MLTADDFSIIAGHADGGNSIKTLYAEELAGKTTFSARKAVVEALQASGDLDGEAALAGRVREEAGIRCAGHLAGRAVVHRSPH